MSDSGFAIDPTGDLGKALAEFPSSLVGHLNKGFAVLSRFPQERYVELATVVAESVGMRMPNTRLSATRLGIDDEEGSPLLTAVSLAIAYLAAGTESNTPEKFADATANVGILPRNAREPFLRFAAVVVEQRPSIKQILERDNIGTQLLPSLSRVQTTVDLRPKFVKGCVSFAVPVALIYVHTDEERRSLCFQATKLQLQTFVKELNETLERIESAEQWAGRKVQTPS